jgi:hypothetical protein
MIETVKTNWEWVGPGGRKSWISEERARALVESRGGEAIELVEPEQIVRPSAPVVCFPPVESVPITAADFYAGGRFAGRYNGD